MGTTLYELIGVPFSASTKDIEAACLRLAETHRPDRTNDPESEKKFADLETAYEVLLDPAKRAEYDRETLSTEDYLRSIPMGRKFVARTWQEAARFDTTSLEISRQIMDLESTLARVPNARVEGAIARLQQQLENREQDMRSARELMSGITEAPAWFVQFCHERKLD